LRSVLGGQGDAQHKRERYCSGTSMSHMWGSLNPTE
jgi:hypothetical protein